VIRPEMTPTVARMVAQIHREVVKPIRWYAIPNLMRYEKPQRGRLREFWQYNADIFGAGKHGEAEIIQMAVALLRSFGANHEHFEVHINDRRFVDLVFEKLIGLEAEPTKKLYKLVDKKNKMEPAKFSAQVLEITASQEKADLFEAFVSLNSVEELKAFVNKQSVDEETFNASVKPLLDLFDLLAELNLKEYV